MNSSLFPPSWSRRSFLKTGFAAAALPAIPGSLAAQSAARHLSAVPNVSDLAGSRLIHAWRDLYNSPATQNEYGYVQAANCPCRPLPVAEYPKWRGARASCSPVNCF